MDPASDRALPEDAVARLGALRAEVDRVDDALLALLRERAALVATMGPIKRAAGLPGFDLAREAACLARLTAGATPPLDAAAVRRVFRAVLAEGRRIVRGEAAP